ncbi:MAG TPA: hypothetical protein VJV79_01080 [Polyangiaceae bacterium]|nr:hypothetical protein [Polyangiaceae bacterium]
MGRLFAGVLGCSLLVACGQGSAAAPVRSPSLDYTPPTPTTSDGDTVGADRRGPGDKLHEGVTSDGPAPGWNASKNGLTFDPKDRVGGAVDPPPANGSSPAK